MKNNVFITNNERCKMKEGELRGIMEEFGQIKSLNFRFHPNNTRNEAICFSTEEEALLAIREINIYIGWRPELYKPTKKSREFKRVTKKQDNSNKEHEQRKNNESSTKQVELSYLKEEIKDIKKNNRHTTEKTMTRDTKHNKKDSTDKKKENQAKTN